MKKYSIIILTLIFIIPARQCPGQDYDFSHRSQLGERGKGWYEITLNPEILQEANQSLNDLRILGFDRKKDTLEAPYLLKLRKTARQVETRSMSILNQGIRDQAAYFTLKLDQMKTINEIELDFENENFDWRITLQASHDQQEWLTILTDYRVVSIKNEDVNYQYTKLRFNPADFNYYRLVVNDQEAKLSNATLKNITTRKGDYKSYAVTSIDTKEIPDIGDQVIEFTIPYHVPLSKIEIDVKAGYDYYRRFELKYLRDSVKITTDEVEQWHYYYETILSGHLSSLEDAVFRFNPVKCKQLRLVINNEDNDPLPNVTAQVAGPVYRLITRIDKKADYFLYFGSTNIRSPKYDLVHFEDKIPDDRRLITPGHIEENDQVMLDDEASSTINKAWLWAIMIIIIVILGWFTFKMIKS